MDHEKILAVKVLKLCKRNRNHNFYVTYKPHIAQWICLRITWELTLSYWAFKSSLDLGVYLPPPLTRLLFILEA